MVESEQTCDDVDEELYLLHLELIYGADVRDLLSALYYCEFLSSSSPCHSLTIFTVSQFPDLFTNTYHFSEGVGGLAYLGLGVGFFSASVFGAKAANKIYTTLADRNGGKGTPEMRIPALIFGSFFVPVGLL